MDCAFVNNMVVLIDLHIKALSEDDIAGFELPSGECERYNKDNLVALICEYCNIPYCNIPMDDLSDDDDSASDINPDDTSTDETTDDDDDTNAMCCMCDKRFRMQDEHSEAVRYSRYYGSEWDNGDICYQCLVDLPIDSDSDDDDDGGDDDDSDDFEWDYTEPEPEP
eukprot:COSAG05_NODE_503_length_9211_cov_44.051361_3_plen_167_part_00